MPARPGGKKLFTLASANATLPLLRSILRDVTSLATELRDRYQRLKQIGSDDKQLAPAHREEFDQITKELERGQQRMEEYDLEIRDLGVELKDPFMGLVDFPCWMDEHEVYLCWKLGEVDVAHWHELDAGFAGRQRLAVGVPQN